MTRIRRFAVAGTAALLAASYSPANAYPRPSTALMVSVNDRGVPADASSGYNPGPVGANISTVAMTPDGRYLAFSSAAGNLAASATAQVPQIYVRDVKTGHTTQVSVTSTGAQAELTPTEKLRKKWGSYDPSISNDGRYVAFWSYDERLAPGKAGAATTLAEANNQADVFVHDMVTKSTRRVSLTAAENLPNASSYSPSLSADGHFVAFTSGAGNIVPNQCGPLDTLLNVCLSGFNTQIYVRDLRTNTTQAASVFRSGELATQNTSTTPSLTANGRYVVFGSSGSDLTADAPAAGHSACYETCGDYTQSYVRDLVKHKTILASIGLDGRPGNNDSGPEINSGNAFSTWQAISPDGRYVTFMSEATNLIPYRPPLAGTNPAHFIRDLATGRTECVSVLSSGAALLATNGGTGFTGAAYGSLNDGAHLSNNGRFVAFSTWGDQTTGDYSGNQPFYGVGTVVYDRVTGALDAAYMPRRLNPTGIPVTARSRRSAPTAATSRCRQATRISPAARPAGSSTRPIGLTAGRHSESAGSRRPESSPSRARRGSLPPESSAMRPPRRP